MEGLCEKCKAMLRRRTKEKLRELKANGVQLGRPTKENLRPHIAKLVRMGFNKSEMTRILGISRNTVNKYYPQE